VQAHDEGPTSTRNLYLVDEVLSALQKAIRRSLVNEALFWTLELARSGLGALAMVRFGVICSEDVSLGCPCLPQYVLAARRRFSVLCKDGMDKEASDQLLQCAEVLASSFKNRMPATAAVWVYWRLDRELDAASGKRHWLTFAVPKRMEFLKQSMATSAAFSRDAATSPASAAQQQHHEETALLCLQSLYLDDKTTQIWDALLAMARTPPPPQVPSEGAPSDSFSLLSCHICEAMHALYDMVQERVSSAERYCMIHALLLYSRQHLLLQPVCPVSPPQCTCSKQLQERWPGRAFPIPSYAIDKHTRRGGTGGQGTCGRTVKGEDTRQVLLEAARYWRVDTSSWSSGEVARSHGDGVERALHAGEGEGGVSARFPQSLLTNFYEEGVLVEDEFMPESDGRDPYKACAQAYNLGLEERFAGRIPKGWVKESLAARLKALKSAAFDGAGRDAGVSHASSDASHGPSDASLCPLPPQARNDGRGAARRARRGPESSLSERGGTRGGFGAETPGARADTNGDLGSDTNSFASSSASSSLAPPRMSACALAPSATHLPQCVPPACDASAAQGAVRARRRGRLQQNYMP
jgi:hypothetical protein